ncbi:MAG TPA: carboxypeptidase regulatory-like domain-containing protein [Pyrinomonadaceae bacterium]|nr:carboxypeptidase regulatory-like domain-containing protein [Pyrinomonadaceae bacterium]
MHSGYSRLFRQFSFLMPVVFAVSSAIMAQAVTAGLLGTVTDPQGAVVAGAEITLTEPSTKISRTVITDGNGNYDFHEVKPGIYQVKVSKQGFTTFVADNVLVENLQKRRVDAALNIGETAQTVNVEAGAALITTEGGTITSSIDKKRVADNPSIDTYPYPYSLFTTLPGVQGNGWDLKVSGQNTAQQTIGLDGVINDRFGEQNNNINFYEEANLTTVNATADNARVVNYNLVSKRGQNAFHGMVYYKRFDSTFNARDWADPGKTYQLQHEAQVEGSGPIWKNHTFFYASWFYHRIPTGGPRDAFVPTAAERNGDFSASQTTIIDPQTGQPFPGNIIPADRISSVSRAFESYYPLPNAVLANGNNFAWTHPFADDYFRASFPFIRIDHQFNSKNSLYGKWTQRKTPYVLDYSNLPGLFWTRLRDHSQFSATDTHVFRANLINSFTFGLSRDYIVDGTETAKGYKEIDGNEVIAKTGIQGMNPGGLKGAGFPAVNISGFRSLSVAVAGGVKNRDKTYSFEDNVTWTRGRHSFKFGGDYVKFTTFSGEVPNYGSVSFNGFATRVPGQTATRENAYADFLLGIPRSSSRVSPRIDRARTINELGFFITDSFKFSRKLTLDLGLRWDYYGLARYKDGLQYNFDPKTGSVIIPPGTRGEIDPRYPSSVNIIEGQVVPKADRGNIRPRFAAAYRFADDFVLRAGYGAFTERFSRFYTDFALGGGPFSTSGESFTNSITNGVPAFSFPNPFLSDNSGRSPLGARSVSGVPLKNDDGVIHQFNVSLEKELFGLGWRASYIGSRGTGLRGWVQLNAQPIQSDPDTTLDLPYPQFARNGVSYILDDFGSRYDAIQFEVQRRKGDFTFDAHYTYAISKNNINNSPDPFTPNAQWANDPYNRRNLAVITTTWHLPVGRGRRFLSDSPAFVDAILGGWKLQTVSYIGSGFYVTPYSCNNSGNINLYGGDCYRPDQIGNPELSRGERNPDRWFDGTAFADPGPGTYGNALAASIEGPGIHAHHLSVAKTFSFSERYKLTFTAAFSNIFNTPNFDVPDSDIYSDDSYSGQRIYYTTGNGGGAPENAGHRVGYFKLRFEF